MKNKLIGVFLIIMLTVGGIGYWYYNESQARIQLLTENNAKLTVGIALNEETINQLQTDYGMAQQELIKLNDENAAIRRRNNLLIDKFANNNLGFLAENKPELIERIINRGTANAFRCMELLSGAELTDKERNATNGTAFNPECPWLFDSNVQP
jgi:hypothetical protein